jgi:hypothetical protein
MAVSFSITRNTTRFHDSNGNNLKDPGELDFDFDEVGVYDPGDLLYTRIKIINTGDQTATGVTIGDNFAGSTFVDTDNVVTGTVFINVSPIAFNNTFQAIGNTVLRVGTGSTIGAGTSTFFAGNLTSNDEGSLAGDQIPGFQIDTVANGVTVHGGKFNIFADGTFNYLNDGTDTNAELVAGDTFTYTIRDKGYDGVYGTADDLTSTATVTITFALQGGAGSPASRVWYVDPSYDGSQGAADGTSARPFTTMAPLNLGGDVDSTGEYIYVKGTATGPIGLEDGQKLIGTGVALVVNGTTLALATSNSTLNAPSGTIVTLGVGNSISGINIGNGTGTGTNGITGTSFGTLDISSSAIDVTGQALNLAFGTIAGTGLTSTTSDGGAATSNVILNTITGTLNLGGGALAGTTSTASSFIVTDGTVSVNYSGTIDRTAGTGALINVNGNHTGGTLTFTGALSATSGTGLQFTNADGTYSMTGVISLTGTGDAGIDILNGSGGTFTFGTAVNTATITNSSGGDAFVVDDTSGGAATTANVTYNGSITDNNGNAVFIDNHDGGTITFQNGAITSVSGAGGIDVTNSNGGTVNFNTQITLSTGANDAVNLANNTGSTINFNATGNGLDINSSGGMGFSATGGGTVTVTASGTADAAGGNTIITTTGSALNIQNTNIGLAGVTFQSVHTTNVSANSGINLTNTGVTAGVHGGLTVTGTDGADAGTMADSGTGGTISNKSVDAIILNSTRAVSLNGMTVNNITTAGSWIDADNVFGLTLNNFNANNSFNHGIDGTNITNLVINGGKYEGGGTLNSVANFDGIHITSLLGTSSITNATFERANTRQIFIVNSSATNFNGAPDTLTVSGNTFQNHNISPFHGDHLSVSADTGGNMKLVVDSSVAANIFRTAGIAVQATGAGSGKMEANISGITSGGSLASGFTNTAGVVVAGTATSTVKFNVSNNTILGSGSVGMSFNDFTSGSYSGTISGNNITHVAGTGTDALQIVSHGDGNGTLTNDGVATIAVLNNTIVGNFQRGIRAQAAFDQAVLNINISGNTVHGTDPTLPANGGLALRAIEVEVGGSGGVTSDKIFLNLENNNAWMDNGNAGYRLLHRGVGTFTFSLEDYTGSPTSEIDVINWIDNVKNNNSNGGAATTLITGEASGFSTHANTPAPLMAAAPPPSEEVATEVFVDNPKVDNSDPGTGGSDTPDTSGSDAPNPPIPAGSVIVEDGVLTQPELDFIVDAAIQRWAAAGASEAQIAAMRAVLVSVEDLGGRQLGESKNGVIKVDVNGAGWNWYVDATPGQDEEYAGSGTSLAAVNRNSMAGTRIDLLTVITHELGHQIGLGDLSAPGDASDLMYGTISAGERRLPGSADIANSGNSAVTGAFAFAPITLGSIPVAQTVIVEFRSVINSPTQDGLVGSWTGTSFLDSADTSEQPSNSESGNVDGLALTGLLYTDVNKNGTYDAGDTVLSGVAVTLYGDTNNNGVYDDGVDLYVGYTEVGGGAGYQQGIDTPAAAGTGTPLTATTTAGGIYSFGPLAPGDYIVVVPAANFGAGVLGNRRAHPNAPDPDDNNADGDSLTLSPADVNVDNDNNGQQFLAGLPGAFVASRAITLSYGNETVAGPTGPALDTNDTLDLGFDQPNLPPSGTSSTAAINEDAPRTLARGDFGFGDTDGGNFLEVKINSVTGGTLTVNGVAATFPATVTVAQLDANQVVFTPTQHLNGTGAGSIVFQVRDDGGTDNGGVDTDQSANTLTFNIAAVNDPVSANNPSVLTVTEDTPKAITGLSISDVDAALAPNGVYVVTLNAFFGRLTLSTLTGLTFSSGDGTDDGNMTFRGTLAAINTALATATFSPVANYSGPAEINFAVTDDFGGTIATGSGSSTTDSDTVAVTVTAVNDAPVAGVATSPVAVGVETRANTTTAGDQANASVAGLPGGGHVVTWASANQDGSGLGIYIQRFDGNGAPLGVETRVNTTTAGDQGLPSVTALNGGGYVVTWQSIGQDTSGSGIYMQRYNASGVAQGVETKVNTTVVGDQQDPSVSALADGGYVVVWMSPDGSANGIVGQRYNAAGVAQGGEIAINNVTTNEQQFATVVGLVGGGFAVTWFSADGEGNGSQAVFVRRFDAAGVDQGNAVRVNTFTAGDQSYPGIGATSDGGYVVAWESINQDGSGYGVYAQRYNSSGATVGAEFRVNSTTANSQEVPVVTGLDNGGFVVSWRSFNQDGSDYGVYAQRYDASGIAVGSETRVNTFTTGSQSNPAVDALAGGGFVISWQSLGQDGSTWGVYSQRFADGFSATEQVPVSLKNSVTVSDVDAGSAVVSATLSVGYGVINVGVGGSGATVSSGNGTGSVVVTGTIAQINALLRTDGTSTVTYTANTDSPPATTTFTVSVDDGGASGSGGPLTGSDSATITITSVNDAPAGTDNIGTLTTNEDTRLVLTAANFGFSDPDGNSFTGVLVTTTPGFGTLYIDTDGAGGTLGTAVVAGNFVTIADINAGRLVYVPNANQSGSETFTFKVRDNGGTLNGGVDTDGSANTIGIAVTAVNDAPVNNMGIGPVNTSEDATAVAISGMSVADTEATGDVSYTLSVEHGTLTIRTDVLNGIQLSDIQVVPGTGNGTDTIIITATIAQINATLANATGLTYTPTLNYNGTDSLTAYVNDIGQTGADPGGPAIDPSIAATTEEDLDVRTINISAVNDAPTVGDGSEALAAANEDQVSALPGDHKTVLQIFGPQFSDVDSGDTLAGVAVVGNDTSGTNGRWQYWNGAAWANIGSGTDDAAFALTAATPIRFLPNLNYFGAAPTLSVRLIDSSGAAFVNGATLDANPNGTTTRYSSGVVTLDQNITAVNDAPVLDLDSTTGGTGANNGVYEQDANGALGVAPNATVSDVDSANFDTGTLTVSITANAQAGDVLDMVDFTDGAGHDVTISGNEISYNGVVVATYTAGDHDTAMVITFDADATPEAAQWVTRAVNFLHTSDNPTAAARTLHYVLTDGDGGTASADASVTVTQDNDAPVLADPTSATLAYTEGAPAIALMQGVTVSDVDLPANFLGGSITLAVTGVGGAINLRSGSLFSVSAGNLVYDNAGTPVTIGSVSGVGTNSVSIDLNSNATPARVNDLVDDFVYSNATDDIGAADRTATLTFNDGNNTGNVVFSTALTDTATQTIDITPVDDAPAVDLNGAGTGGINNAAAYSEDAPAQILASGLELTDPDDVNLEGATVSIGTGFLATKDALSIGGLANGTTGTGGAISFSYSSITGVLTLTGSASKADYQAALRQVAFSSTSQAPGTNRTISWKVNDGDLDSASATTSVTVTPINDAPLSANSSVTGSEDDPKTIFATDFPLNDPEGDSLLAVRITVLPIKGQLLLNGVAVTAGQDISAADLDAGKLTYQPVIDEYASPYTTFKFRVIDTGGTNNGGLNTSAERTMTVNISPDNTPPTVDLEGGDAGTINYATTYTENGPGVAIGSSIAIADVDEAIGDKIESATITITDPATGDALSVSGTLPAGITIDISSTASVLKLVGAASTADYQAALALVRYANSSDDPTSVGTDPVRTITVVVNDGVANSAPATTTVTVAASNDGPVNTVPGAKSGSEDQNLVITGISVSDPDAGGNLKVTLSVAHGKITLSSTAGLAFSAGDGTADATMTFTGTVAAVNAALASVTYRGDLNYNGADTLTMTSSDQGFTGSGGTKTDTDTVAITLAPDGIINDDSGNNTLVGTPFDDIFVINQGGVDNVSGLAGNDIFYFGDKLTSADIVNGGGGTDTIALQGNYGAGLTLTGNVTEIEAISLLSGANTRFGEPGTNRYDYNITVNDANFTGGIVKINGGNLLAGEDFTFNGAAEDDARFLIYGGFGQDNLTGGQQGDVFFFDGGTWQQGDKVDGQGGYDALFLRGNYTIDFNAAGWGTAFTGIENLTVTSQSDTRYASTTGGPYNYAITFADALLGAGETLTVNAALLQPGEALMFDGHLETSGRFRFFGGQGADTFIGGSGNDDIYGGGGADVLQGNGGVDFFRYDLVSNSTAAAKDTILGFDHNVDKIDLSQIDAKSATAGDEGFTFINASPFSGLGGSSAGELRAYQVSSATNLWQVEGDVDGDGSADFVLQVYVNAFQTLTGGDFFF